ncbi:MAG: DUF166 family protein [Anaerolineales bacterium]
MTNSSGAFRLLAVTQGQWGERIAENITKHAPSDWQVATWSAPRVLPQVIDEPEDFLPPALPQADLVLALGDTAGLAQLIPDIVRRTQARAVIAPIDRNTSLPAGLAGQLKQWLDDMGVASVFPRPFCSLGEQTYNHKPLVEPYQDKLIRRFSTHFGRPKFKVAISEGRIQSLEVLRDAACGCARHVAQGLVGTSVDEALEKAGLLHHHYPCLASMNKDIDYNDTLMHVSGNILKDSIKEQERGHLTPTPYLRPHGLSEQEQEAAASVTSHNPGPDETEE